MPGFVRGFETANGLVLGGKTVTGLTQTEDMSDGAVTLLKMGSDALALMGSSDKILTVTTGINGKATGTTNLYTVPTGKTVVVTRAVVMCDAAVSITTGPQAGVGVAAGEDDVFTSQGMDALTTTAKLFHFTATGMSVKVVAGGVVKLGIDVPAVGTSQTLSVILFGVLI